ncbi:transmembrane protein 205 isoform X2 [Hemicordylus capensis]|uniref:transmembrane protein 205 isoform X2 n=1 Tax=Hemicordylus capensis TaxID=884348 RepID=UPI002303D990|nr:transmembrane protein 205 isoform X2 [Hemicordylus capensis]
MGALYLQTNGVQKFASRFLAAEMPAEGEPSGLVRTVQLFTISTAWGMQIWVTFIAGFVLIRGVSRHTFGLVQSKLFPFYFYTLIGCTVLNLVIFATYHPWKLLNITETIQIMLFFICLILAVVNATWFSQATTSTMFKMQQIEKEHGLGEQVGLSARREDYKRLKEKDAKYRCLRQKFFKYHGLSSLCNLACVICTAVNLAILALQLESL